MTFLKGCEFHVVTDHELMMHTMTQLGKNFATCIDNSPSSEFAIDIRHMGKEIPAINTHSLSMATVICPSPLDYTVVAAM